VYFPEPKALYISCKSTDHFIPAKSSKAIRNEILSQQSETIPNFLWGDTDSGLSDIHTNVQTQIKQYLCGADVVIESETQAHDFVRFAFRTNDSNLIAYSLHLYEQYCAITETKDQLFEEWLNDEFTNPKSNADAIIKQIFISRIFGVHAEHSKFCYNVTNPYGRFKEVFRDKMIEATKNNDLILTCGQITTPVNLDVMKMNSEYFRAFDNFHSGAVKEMDLTGLVDEHLFQSWVQFMYDPRLCQSWDFDFNVQMLRVADALCCDAIFTQLVYRLTELLNIEKLQQAFVVCSMYPGRCSVLENCCMILAQKHIIMNTIYES
jgi:hypothetical protein